MGSHALRLIYHLARPEIYCRLTNKVCHTYFQRCQGSVAHLCRFSIHHCFLYFNYHIISLAINHLTAYLRF
jgi:hypothetical protein